MTERIVVTGADGFVGRGVVATLSARGKDIVPLVRQLRDDSPEGARETGDLSAGNGFGSLLEGVDAIVHCAARAHVLREETADPLAAFRAANRDATLALARAAAAAGVRRFVFLSSIGVLGNETKGRPFRAGDPPAPHSHYAIAKAEAEEGLKAIAAETGLEIVIVRPPLVLGAGAKGNLGLLVGAMRKGRPLPLGLVTGNRRDLVSLNTLADLIATAVDHPAAAGATLLVADGRPLSTRAIVERLAALEGLRPWLVPVPPRLLGAGLRLLGKSGLSSQLLADLEVDIAATRDRLGWTPQAPDGERA